MRNLKKILALVLALVMSMSLLATANAFSDDKNIDPTYNEAITVLANLGVFEGYKDGSFQPKGDITRAETAAIIYRIVTGDVEGDDVKLYSDYKKFNDVKSTDWFAGYVNYCANAGYIMGRDGKTFDPQGKVTGYEALAMILRAVGYGKMGEFTGSQWQVNVASRAKSLGLTDNVIPGTLGTPATREIVAEVLFRSILVPQVEYTPAFGYQTSKLTGILGDNAVDNASLGAQTFGLALTVGEITAVDYHDGITEFTPVVETKDNDNALDHKHAVIVKDTDANWENIGYVGYAYTVKTAGAKTRTAVSDVTLTGESLAVSHNGTAYKDLVKKDVTLDDNARFYLNGVELGKDNDIKAAQELVSERGVKIDFIDNDNSGKIEVVVVTHYTPAVVTGIATDVNAGSNATKKDHFYLTNLAHNNKRVSVATKNMVCADELAMDDLVTYVEYDDVYYTVVAPLTTDTLDQITREKVDDSNKSDYIYTIGDADYLTAFDFDVFDDNRNVLVKANLDKSVDVYTDPYGYVLTAALTSYDTNYVFVMANEQTAVKAGTTDTRLAFTDGNIEWMPVDVVVDENGKKDDFFYASPSYIDEENNRGIANHIYAYSEKDGEYTLYDAGCDHAEGIDYTNGKADFGKLGLNKNSVVIDLRAKYLGEVYNGYKEVPSLTNASVHYLANKNDIITLAYLVDGDNSEDLSANFIVFNTDVNRVKVSSSQYVYYLDVLVDGKLVEDFELTDKQYDDIEKFGVGHYVYNSKGKLDYTTFAEDWKDVSWSHGTLTIYNEDGGKDYVEYDEVPFNVLTIDKGAVDGYSMMYGMDEKAVKAYVLYNKNGSVKEIYIIANSDEDKTAEDLLAPMTGKGFEDDTADHTYYAKEDMVTNFSENEKPVEGNLWKVLVNGVEAVTEDGINYVATLTSDNLTNADNRLVAQADYAGAKMELWNKDMTAKIGEENGVGTIKDAGKYSSTTAASEWNIISDGVKHNVKVVINSTADELIDAATAGSTVKLPAGTYANLTIDKNLIIDGSNGAKLTGVVKVAGADVTNVTIKNCEIEVKGSTAEGCVVSDTTAAAGAVVTLSNNTFTVAEGKNAVCAIYIDAQPGRKYIVTGNTFEGAFTEGAVDIDMSYGASSIVVEGNNFSGVTGNYIHIHNVNWSYLDTDVKQENIATK